MNSFKMKLNLRVTYACIKKKLALIEKHSNIKCLLIRIYTFLPYLHNSPHIYAEFYLINKFYVIYDFTSCYPLRKQSN